MYDVNRWDALLTIHAGKLAFAFESFYIGLVVYVLEKTIYFTVSKNVGPALSKLLEVRLEVGLETISSPLQMSVDDTSCKFGC